MTETAPKIEYNTQVKVLDVREFPGYETPEVGVCVIGGLVGELILVFNAIYQSVIVNPNNAEFKFTAETIEKFLSEILPEEYPENIALIRTSTELMTNQLDDVSTVAEVASKKLLVSQFHSAFGLKFLIDTFPVLSLNDNVNNDVFKALCMINYQQPIELLPEPHEEDDNYEQRLADVHHRNEEAKKKNEKLQKLHSRCRIEVTEAETNYAQYEEQCLIMLNNYREIINTADG